ncbi:hypothetical protein ThvES_00017580 [Thiovulum sp. ES]|nr:hypothetical protein ThvES_00017580 [Thiovulum sp. ES]
MEYLILTSHFPVPLEKVKPLEELGLIIPFDPKNLEINVYAYKPKSLDLSMNSLEDVHDFFETSLTVTQSEVDKQISKITVLNQIKEGDLVFTHYYPNLSMRVSKISGDLLKAQITLKAFSTEILLHKNNFYKAKEDTLPINISEIVIKAPKGNLYIDCDSLEHSDHYNTFESIFTFILSTKLLYSNLNLVLLNPLGDMVIFAELFGLEMRFGSIVNLLLDRNQDTDKVLTNNLKLFSIFETLIILDYTDTIIEPTELHKEDFLEELGLESEAQLLLYLYLRYTSRTSILKIGGSDASLLKSVKKSYETLLEQNSDNLHSYLLGDNETYIEESRDITSLREIKEELKAYGLIFYVYNIEYYFRLIKG